MSDRRMCATTRWLGRRGMASPALAVLAAFASRRSVFCFRERAFLPDIALKHKRGGCRVRAVVRRGFQKKVVLREKESLECRNFLTFF